LTLLPEGRETVEKAYNVMGHNLMYPVTELLLGFGFLLILLIESVTISCYRKHKKIHKGSEPRPDIETESESQTSVDPTDSTHKCDNYCASYQNGHVTVIPRVQGAEEQRDITPTSPRTEIKNDSQLPDHCLSENIYGEGMSNLHSIVLLMALSIHMIFDGLSLGLLPDENEVWSLLMALGIHKILIFFSTGITICESTTTMKFIIAMLYMSIVSPLGAGLGILLTSQSANVSLTIISAFLQAVAVGTFVYVAFFEILLKEFTDGENMRIAKSISTVFGYCIFAGIKFIMPE
jgi:zinc transporter 1/2/3